MADLSAKAQEKEIDGVVYRAWPIPFSSGRPVLVRLLKIMSPVLSGVFRAGTKGEMAAAVFDALPSVISDEDLSYFGRVFGDAAQYKNDRGEWAPLIEKVQSAHFDGRYLAYFEWIVFAAKVNFGNFFGGLKSAAGDGGFLQTMTSG